MQIYVEHWGDDSAKLTIFGCWEDDLAKLIVFRYWGDKIGSHGEFYTSIQYIGVDAVRLICISPITLGFASMLIEFPKNIGKSRDNCYPTDQKTSSMLVPTIILTNPIVNHVLQAKPRRKWNPKPVQRFPIHDALLVTELQKNRCNLANNGVYKPTLCQKKARFRWC